MQPERTPTVRWVALSHLIGAAVALVGSAPEAASEAAADIVGTVRELLLDPRSGAVSWALVDRAPGDERPRTAPVAVPARRLRWNSEARRLELRLARGQLERAPTLDPDHATDPAELNEAVAELEAAWSEEAVEARPAGHGTEPRGPTEPASQVLVFEGLRARRTSDRCVPAGALERYPVMARARRFGLLDELVLDARALRAAFAVISRGPGDERVLLPYEDLTVCEDLDHGERLLCIDRSRAQLERGPRYDLRPDGSLDVEALRRASEAN